LGVDVIPALLLWDLDFMERVDFTNEICFKFFDWSNFLSSGVIYYDVSHTFFCFSLHQGVLVLEKGESEELAWCNVVVKELLSFIQKILPRQLARECLLINGTLSSANMETARNFFISNISESGTDSNSLLAFTVDVHEDFVENVLPWDVFIAFDNIELDGFSWL
jgi:hypothetical protein